MSDYTKDSSIDPERMQQWTMASKLPYALTKGVTATLYKLTIDEGIATYQSYLFPFINAGRNGVLSIPWPDAAERLRYRPGAPFCYIDERGEFTNELYKLHSDEVDEYSPLHRLVAILVDDTKAFRMLHWCINNLA